ncbi:UBXN4 [Bugula neritina]|uniref:UBX domain-containing protein 4 n=1 Tax=Bugula neritina TaxID=10212 RepID=A0A7J7IYL0_BUGNE|nr:UBXN4 [Bugula neritina]
MLMHSALLLFRTYDGEESKQMNEVWEDEEITQIFIDRSCIPLILSKDSIGGQQFSQIYTVTSIPSTHFISSNGQLLATLGCCPKEELMEKALSTLPQRPSEQQRPEHPEPVQQTAEPSVSPSPQSATVTSESEGAVGGAVGDSTAENLDEKVQRAKELIEEKQKQKLAEEKQKAQAAEIERRRMGKDLEKLKQYQAEKEAKETRDALRKEKEETRIAREKVKEQIQKDREARNAKYQQEKAAKEEALLKKQQEKLAKESEEAARIAVANSQRARIQFRLPDGSTINHIFDADDTLQAAWDFLVSHPSHSMGRNFRLAAVYPRRVFDGNDYQSSFRTLSLVPTSALLVLPPASGSGAVKSASTGSLTMILNAIFAPLILIWQYIQRFIFGAAQPARSNESVQTRTPDDGNQQQDNQRSDSPSERPRRRVGRLSDLSPDGDDQNTWNGNSTQQM